MIQSWFQCSQLIFAPCWHNLIVCTRYKTTKRQIIQQCTVVLPISCILPSCARDLSKNDLRCTLHACVMTWGAPHTNKTSSTPKRRPNGTKMVGRFSICKRFLCQEATLLPYVWGWHLWAWTRYWPPRLSRSLVFCPNIWQVTWDLDLGSPGLQIENNKAWCSPKRSGWNDMNEEKSRFVHRLSRTRWVHFRVHMFRNIGPCSSCFKGSC